MTLLECHIDRAAGVTREVVIRVAGTVLPPCHAVPDLPGIEYARVFDATRAALLGWSPNVAACLPVTPPGLSGRRRDVGVEDAIDAVVFSLTLTFPDLGSQVVTDSEVLNAVSGLASKSPDAPTGLLLWEGCLARSLELFVAVRDGDVNRLALDLDRHTVEVVPTARPRYL